MSLQIAKAGADLDKQSINYASVFGMNTDLHLSGQDYSWVVTLFYFGQMAGTFLTAYFISRFHVVRVVGLSMYDLLSDMCPWTVEQHFQLTCLSKDFFGVSVRCASLQARTLLALEPRGSSWAFVRELYRQASWSSRAISTSEESIQSE